MDGDPGLINVGALKVGVIVWAAVQNNSDIGPSLFAEVETGNFVYSRSYQGGFALLHEPAYRLDRYEATGRMYPKGAPIRWDHGTGLDREKAVPCDESDPGLCREMSR
jgi:hypothetical protein